MDKQFLEFWGNVFLAAARGQSSMASLSQWITQGMKGAGDVGALFRQFYGLGEAGGGDSTDWNTAQEAFQQAFRGYLDLLQVVPRSEHEALRQQCDALAARVAEQDTIIAGLRRELRDSLAASGDTARGFEELVKIQSDEFRKLTDSVGRLFTKKPSPK